MEPSLRARVRGGDQDAFGELFDQHASAVYNQAFRLTLNWSTAEEVVSLTFLEAWRLRAGIDEAGGSLRPWLLGIALNVTRNLNRAARRHQAAMSRLPAAPPVPDFAEDLRLVGSGLRGGRPGARGSGRHGALPAIQGQGQTHAGRPRVPPGQHSSGTSGQLRTGNR
jgi:DNA-directed RNA polymerase specialized sigma24 family protein